MSHSASPPVVPGYVVGAHLGLGGSSTVWAAVAEESGDAVALKVLDGTAGGPSAEAGVAGDAQEAGVAGQITEAGETAAERGERTSSPHLVRTRERTLTDDGRCVVVMDLAAGGSLRDLVARRDALPLGELVTALSPIASALADLHAAGVVHGDVAPGNVLFTADGVPRLGDLGAARFDDRSPWPDVSYATPGFTPPEVLRGGAQTPAGDVWALGAVVWYARSGGGTPPASVGDVHWTSRFGGPAASDTTDDPFDEVVCAVGPELRPIVIRMLADEAAVRPSAAEAALALYRVADAEPLLLSGPQLDPAAAVTTRIRRDAADARSRSERRRAELAERRRQRLVRLTRPVSVVARHRTPRRWAGVAAVAVVLVGSGVVITSELPGMRVDLASSIASPFEEASEPTSEVTSGPTSGTTSQTTSSTATGSSAAALDPGTDPRSDPVAALQRLASQRAEALESRDVALLDRIEPPGSPASAGDRAIVAQLVAHGQRYEGLALVVRSAVVTQVDTEPQSPPGSPTPTTAPTTTPTSVTVRAVVDRSAYVVVGQDGSRQEAAAGPGTALDYRLVPPDDGSAGPWRLSEVG